MKVAIVGSRSFNDYALLCKEVESLVGVANITHMVSGGAKGADKLGEVWAKEHNVPTIIHRAEWSLFGRRAGMMRNSKIIDDADVVIAFWDGVSKGTDDSIKKAKKAGKRVHVVYF